MSPRTRLSRRFFSPLGYAVASLIAVVLLLEFASFVGLSAYHRVHPDTQDNFADISPAYTEYPWAQEFWKEERLRWKSQHNTYQPFRIWGVGPWHGKYINTDDTPYGSWRTTTNPTGCQDQSSLNVWMFGGSTTYGTGVPDWATLPSFLSRDLNSAGLGCVGVTNFGTEGYVTNQEVIFLTEQLKTGRRPGVVIFYDGVNDAYAGVVSPGVPDAHMSLAIIKARVEGSFVGRVDFLRDSSALQLAMAAVNSLHRSAAAKRGEAQTESKAAATLDNYEENLLIIRALGEAYGFKVLCFWQPAFVSGHKPLSPFEIKIASNNGSRDTFDSLATVYQLAERRAAANNSFVFLGDIFDTEKQSLYIDKWMHLTPVGNELVARCIAKYVVENRNERSPLSKPDERNPRR